MLPLIGNQLILSKHWKSSANSYKQRSISRPRPSARFTGTSRENAFLCGSPLRSSGLLACTPVSALVWWLGTRDYTVSCLRRFSDFSLALTCLLTTGCHAGRRIPRRDLTGYDFCYNVVPKVRALATSCLTCGQSCYRVDQVRL